MGQRGTKRKRKRKRQGRAAGGGESEKGNEAKKKIKQIVSTRTESCKNNPLVGSRVRRESRRVFWGVWEELVELERRMGGVVVDTLFGGSKLVWFSLCGRGREVQVSLG